jgi:hypothetical protein
VLQLDVEQVLDDYGGYSGSAVRLAGRRDVAIGVLCEQVQSRHNAPGTGRPRAANVLYAVPAPEVARRFGLPFGDAALRPAAELAGAGEYARAEAALSRLPAPVRDTAGYWYLRARLADARRNPATALAYLDEVFRLDERHPAGIALRLRLLLLGNGARQRAEASALAARSAAVSGPLDAWLRCLEARGMVGPGIRSDTELDALCPGAAPDDDWLGEGWA